MESEFITLAKDKNYMDVLQALGEHMELIRILYPKEYDYIMRKLENL